MNTPVLGKWAKDIKCSTHKRSYRVFSVTDTPPIQTFKGCCLTIYKSKERVRLQVGNITITLHVVFANEHSPILFVVGEMFMHKMSAIASPTKKRPYAMRFLSGWVLQLNNVAIFCCFIRVGITKRRIFDAYATFFILKTNYIFCCLTFYHFKSLWWHEYHVRQSVVSFHNLIVL